MADNTIIDYNSSLNIKDEQNQKLLAARVEKNAQGNMADDTPFEYMTTMSDSRDRDVASAIQRCYWPANSGGTFVKFKNRTEGGRVSSGDRPRDPNNAKTPERNRFESSPQKFNKDTGYLVPDAFYQTNVLTVNHIWDIEIAMSEFCQSLFAETTTICASGRVGLGLDSGYRVWDEDETGGGAGSIADRTSVSFWQELNGTNPLREPVDIFVAGKDSYATAAAPVAADYTASSQLTFETFRHIKRRLTTLANNRHRGLPYERPSMMTYKSSGKWGTGGVMFSQQDARCRATAIISEGAAEQLTGDSDWITAQNAVATKLGAESGQFTGRIGNIFGFEILEMNKMVRFKANGQTVNRGLIFGRSSMLQILANNKFDNSFQHNQRQYMKKFMDTPSSVRIDIAPLQVGDKSAAFLSVAFAATPQAYNVGDSPTEDFYKNKVLSNIFALDSVESD